MFSPLNCNMYFNLSLLFYKLTTVFNLIEDALIFSNFLLTVVKHFSTDCDGESAVLLCLDDGEGVSFWGVDAVVEVGDEFVLSNVKSEVSLDFL